MLGGSVYTMPMKIPTVLLPLFFVSALLGSTPITELKFTWVDADDAAVADVRQSGEDAIQLIGNKLIRETSQVLAAKGAEDAVDLLHLKTFPLPAAAAGKPQITAVKRTSLRVRDPANAPDNADLAALISIQKELMDGNNPPRLLVQRVEASATTPEEWRVYRPISVMASCVVCHGPTDSLLPSVKAKLERLYPEDKATEYAAHQWRGVIRVSVATPAKKP